MSTLAEFPRSVPAVAAGHRTARRWPAVLTDCLCTVGTVLAPVTPPLHERRAG